ncbi:MAG: oleate hydratase [Planctomycetaceae bacterium]|jgi:oleate hydratase|nr:oleate hydratase [Planctomycetaceae bacterium]MBT6497681.1 oleate hydratase [Planctomycetaceae bacterium]
MDPAESIDQPPQAWLVGGGIASLAAAASLIRDGGMPGRHIHVLEQSDVLGGSLDGAGSPETGYVIRGGRMFEEHFVCTYDLFGSIPALDDPGKTVTQQIQEFTRQVVTSSKSRLVCDGRKIEAPAFGLSLKDKWNLACLAVRREPSLGTLRIEEYFSPHFFDSNFWFMWSSMFAFQPWHSLVEFRRYMRRFMHLLPGFNRLEGIYRTPYNQFDSLVLPLFTWLQNQGVQFHMNAQVTGVDFDQQAGKTNATRIHHRAQTEQRTIDVCNKDFVFITLGSMTEDSSLGTMTSAPAQPCQPTGAAWALWENIAQQHSNFGRPGVFASQIDKSKWESFTVTLRSPAFFDFMQDFTGNAAGTGGVVTLKDSNWVMSIVLAYQPHFINQPDGTYVFWGYGLFPDRVGNYVNRTMSDCTGEEILVELFSHLRLGERTREIIDEANCIPCMMPYITSQFMPRAFGDRPNVVPNDAANFAFLGQFCELPGDVVFTVEYSIRSAQTAVYSLLGLQKKPLPLYKGHLHPAVLLRAVKAMIW